MGFNRERLLLRVGAAIFGLVGALLVWGALALDQETRLFRDHGLRTPGVVLDYQSSTSKSKANGTTTSDYPRIRFTDAKGVDHEFLSDRADDPLESPVGDPVDLIYLPEDPTKVRLDSWDTLGGGELLLAGLGAFSIGAGLLVWFVLAAGRPFPFTVGFPLGFAVFAALIGWACWAVSVDSLDLTAHGQRTTAVVANAEGSALVEYTVNGKVYQHQTRVQDQEHPLSPGDPVPLLYDPHKPDRARVDTFDDLWFATALTGGFTVLCGLVSLGSGLFFFLRRKSALSRLP